VDDFNSALLEVDEKCSTENLEEITDDNYNEFRNDIELLLAKVGDMLKLMSKIRTRRKLGRIACCIPIIRRL